MSGKKNILLLMSDEHRVDHVGCYPGARMPTPNIDRLADGVVFTNCLSSNPICTPARSAMLTGKYTHQINMLDMSGDLSRQHPTYAQALQRAGYFTAGIGKFHWLQGWPWSTPAGEGHDLVALDPELRGFGFDLVWEVSGKQLCVKNYCHYAQHLDRKGLLPAYRQYVTERKVAEKSAAPADPAAYPDGEPFPLPEEDHPDVVAADRVVRALRERPRNAPFFILASFCGPHPPYDPPRSYLEAVSDSEADDPACGDVPMPAAERRRWRKIRRAYRAMVHCTDAQVGRVLDALQEEGLADNTVVLFTSDHGSMLGDRGLRGKGVPWPSSVLVPAIVRHPDHCVRSASDAPVELTDLTATMLDIAGLDAQAALSKAWPAFHDRVPCRSLLPIVRGDAETVRDCAFSECEGDWELILTRDWAYVHRCRRPGPDEILDEFYVRAEDPEWRVNRLLDPGMASAVSWCRRRLEFIKDSTPPIQTQWAPYGPRKG